MSEKLFTFLVAFFAAVSNYFHCHCVLFSPIRSSKRDCYLNIFTVSWLFTLSNLADCSVGVFSFFHTHKHRTKFHRFFCVQHFIHSMWLFFSLSSSVDTMRRSVGAFLCCGLVPLHCLMDSDEVFFSFSQSIPVFYFNLMLSSVGYFSGFCVSIIVITKRDYVVTDWHCTHFSTFFGSKKLTKYKWPVAFDDNNKKLNINKKNEQWLVIANNKRKKSNAWWQRNAAPNRIQSNTKCVDLFSFCSRHNEKWRKKRRLLFTVKIHTLSCRFQQNFFHRLFLAVRFAFVVWSWSWSLPLFV